MKDAGGCCWLLQATLGLWGDSRPCEIQYAASMLHRLSMYNRFAYSIMQQNGIKVVDAFQVAYPMMHTTKDGAHYLGMPKPFAFAGASGVGHCFVAKNPQPGEDRALRQMSPP